MKVFLNGKFIPEEKALVPITTHAFQYGTGCFEGIRAYYNERENTLNIFRMKEHYERLLQSAKVLFINVPYTAEKLCKITTTLLKRNYSKQDFYIRPFIYKSDTNIVNFHLPSLKDGIGIFTIPLGRFVDKAGGIRVNISSWTRIGDTSIPPRAKIMGSYVNTSLAKTESILSGYDEALFMDKNGHIVEGSAENIFAVINDTLITPPSSEDILQGITRDTVIQIAQKEHGIEVKEKSISRTELYQAAEVFLVGTGAEVLPVIEMDGRKVGNGKVGVLTNKIKTLYNQIVRGENPDYRHFVTKVLIH